MARDAEEVERVYVEEKDEEELRVEAKGVRQHDEDDDERDIHGKHDGCVDCAALRSLGIASVLMDSSSREHASVGVDHVSGGRQAIAHLLEQGHRRILFLAGSEELQQTRHRLKGAVDAVQSVGLDPSEVLKVVHLPALTANDGQQGLIGALESGWGPTAAFCMNDITALGAMRELRRRGLFVPGDMAVVGYDDLYFASELMTPLTSVRQPMRQLGWAAADLLLTDTPHTLFEPELIVRASSAFRRS